MEAMGGLMVEAWMDGRQRGAWWPRYMCGSLHLARNCIQNVSGEFDSSQLQRSFRHVK